MRELPPRPPGSGFRDDRLGSERKPRLRPSPVRLAAGRQARGRPMRDLPRQPPHRRAGRRAHARRRPAGAPPSSGCNRAAPAVTSTSTAARSGRTASDATATTRRRSRPRGCSITPAPISRCAGNTSPSPAPSCHPTVADPAPPPAFSRPRAGTFARYKPIAHTSCANCHRDPHQGNFGNNCADCHNENGWDVVSPSQQLGESFHDATRFPLRGLHRDVNCKSCHGPFGSRPVQYKGLAFRKCGDCHPDGHEGQLAARAGGAAADCADCHVVSGFSPARFELEQHNKTPFPLSGAHRAANCRSCHLVDPQLGKKVDPAVRSKLARQRRPELRRHGGDASQAVARRLLRLSSRSAPRAVRGSDDGGRRLRRVPHDGFVRENSFRSQRATAGFR